VDRSVSALRRPLSYGNYLDDPVATFSRFIFVTADRDDNTVFMPTFFPDIAQWGIIPILYHP